MYSTLISDSESDSTLDSVNSKVNLSNDSVDCASLSMDDCCLHVVSVALFDAVLRYIF